VFLVSFAISLPAIHLKRILKIASEIPIDTSLSSIASSYSIDYVRYYERQINPLLSGSEGCDLKRAKKIHVILDLLNCE